jgi:predicted 2-oxoglutarate/Fe(II)-dependent dioxygenase YbiX
MEAPTSAPRIAVAIPSADGAVTWVPSHVVAKDSTSPWILLFDMDMAILRLGKEQPEHPSVVSLTGAYHNLVRMWSEP